MIRKLAAGRTRSPLRLRATTHSALEQQLKGEGAAVVRRLTRPSARGLRKRRSLGRPRKSSPTGELPGEGIRINTKHQRDSKCLRV